MNIGIIDSENMGGLTMATMKAIRIHSYGDPDVLVYENAPLPKLGVGEVLIRVQDAGVNPVDWKVREGYLRDIHKLPKILGWDAAGIVEAVGPEVTGIETGSSVFAILDVAKDGAYAQYATVAAFRVAPKPKTLNSTQAAAVPLAALTAWQALFDAAGLSPGQTVLIHAAAGGVGSFAVQLAKWKGAKVIATASARNQDFLQELGADEVLDYNAVRFEDTVRNVDVVFDTVGGDTQKRSWGVLKQGGFLVSIVSLLSPESYVAQGVQSQAVFLNPQPGQLAEIGKLIDAGHIKPMVNTVLPLAEARQAHELSQGGHTRGKIVLHVGD